MTSTARLAARIETSLTPRQAVLLWLEEAHQHRSVTAHIRELKTQADDAYPIVRLPRQVREATKQALRDQKRDLVGRKVRVAERDVVFLFTSS
jgi:hypothetical protein